jgi:hypothetical protein
MDWNLVWIPLGTAVGKSVYGWFKNVIADGSDAGTAISKWEWVQLSKTIVITGLTTLGALGILKGLDAAGAEYIAVGVGFVVTSIWDSISKRIVLKKAIATKAAKIKK